MTEFARSGRARLAYEVAGAGERGVLLLHAGVNDRRSWRHVIDRLAPRHRVVAFDARGFGDTEYEREDGWSPVADAVAVMDAAGLERSLVIACSMGGRDAIDLTLAHPDRVSALLLIGAGVRGTPVPGLTEGPSAALDAQIDAADAAGDIDEVGRLEAWLWLDGPTAREGRVSGPARERFLGMNDRALRAEDPGDPADLPDAWSRLGEIAVPVLWLVGRLDHERMIAIGEQGAPLIGGARLRYLDGVAHVPHLEGDPETLDAVTAFADADLGIVGVGAIAEAIVAGLEGARTVHLSPRSAERAAQLAGRYPSVQVLDSNQAVLERAGVVLVCVRPGVARDVLSELEFRPDHVVISVIVGASLEALRPLVAPAQTVVRAIPLPAVARRAGLTAIHPFDEHADALFAPLGGAVTVDAEDALDALSASTGTIAAHLAYLDTITRWLTDRGIPKPDATRYVAALFGALLGSQPGDFGELAAEHATPGGINEQFLTALRRAGAFATVDAALDDVAARLTRRG